MTISISAAEARKNFSDIVNKVAYGKESVIVTRRGEGVAALVSMDELKLLEQSEDYIDIEDAYKALATPGRNIHAQEFWKQLRL